MVGWLAVSRYEVLSEYKKALELSIVMGKDHKLVQVSVTQSSEDICHN